MNNSWNSLNSTFSIDEEQSFLKSFKTPNPFKNLSEVHNDSSNIPNNWLSPNLSGNKVAIKSCLSTGLIHKKKMVHFKLNTSTDEDLSNSSPIKYNRSSKHQTFKNESFSNCNSEENDCKRKFEIKRCIDSFDCQISDRNSKKVCYHENLIQKSKSNQEIIQHMVADLVNKARELKICSKENIKNHTKVTKTKESIKNNNEKLEDVKIAFMSKQENIKSLYMSPKSDQIFPTSQQKFSKEELSKSLDINIQKYIKDRDKVRRKLDSSKVSKTPIYSRSNKSAFSIQNSKVQATKDRQFPF